MNNKLRQNNTYLSKLNKKQILELLNYIKRFNYEYLDSLELPNNLHFGIEIESERCFRNTIKEFMKTEYGATEMTINNKNSINDFTKWYISNDGSLENGIELSSPIYSDKIEVWKEIKDICEMLKRCKAVATDRTGAHIHFNGSFLGDDYNSFVKLFEIYTIYENILIKFGFGEMGVPRRNLFKYAKPISDYLFKNIDLFKNCTNLKELSIWVPYQKHISMNLKNIKWDNINNECKNTIEFRSPNGTINYIIWQNLISTYAHLLMAAKNKEIDEEFLDYKLKTYYSKNYKNENFLTTVYLKEVLELVDIIFDNNYDKVMFLKQYVNDYDIKNKELAMKKTIAR